MGVSLINTNFLRTHPAQAMLTVMGLCGVVLLFMPFVNDQVAALVFLKFLPPPLPPFRGLLNLDILFWWLAPLVVLPFAIGAGYLRWLLTGRLSRGEARVGYALAVLAASALVVVELVDWWDSGTNWEPVIYSLIAFGAGAASNTQNLRTGTPSRLNALAAMQVVYLPIAVFWILFTLSEGRAQIGTYLAIVPVFAYSAQVVMVANRPWQSLIFFVPWVLVCTGLLVWDW